VKGPKHLWTGDWRAHRDDQPPAVPPLRELPKPPPATDWPLLFYFRKTNEPGAQIANLGARI